jgi:hypothetical protein
MLERLVIYGTWVLFLGGAPVIAILVPDDNAAWLIPVWQLIVFALFLVAWSRVRPGAPSEAWRKLRRKK